MAENFAYEIDNEKPPPYSPDPNEAQEISATPPPTYSQTQNEPPPPSYDTLFGEIRAAQRNAEDRGHFLKSVGKILIDTTGFTISICLLLSIPVLMIVVGALNLGNCRVERLIPIWLLVSGSLLSVIQLVSIGKRIRKKCCSSSESEQNEQNEQNQGFACLITIFTFVSLGWFFAGNVWTYRVYTPNTEDSLSDNYCDHTTYYLAFWLITLTYIAAFCFCCCSCCLASCFTPGRSFSDQ